MISSVGDQINHVTGTLNKITALGKDSKDLSDSESLHAEAVSLFQTFQESYCKLSNMDLSVDLSEHLVDTLIKIQEIVLTELNILGTFPGFEPFPSSREKLSQKLLDLRLQLTEQPDSESGTTKPTIAKLDHVLYLTSPLGRHINNAWIILQHLNSVIDDFHKNPSLSQNIRFRSVLRSFETIYSNLSCMDFPTELPDYLLQNLRKVQFSVLQLEDLQSVVPIKKKIDQKLLELKL